MTARRINPSGIVTLTTDFGTADAYVGALKGVILTLAPPVRLVDIAHDVKPQDVGGGAAVIAGAAGCFPDGTVHVAVVDPGVGTARAPIVIQARGQWFVGPDNGVFSPLTADDKAICRRIDCDGWLRPLLGASISSTFHGRR